MSSDPNVDLTITTDATEGGDHCLDVYMTYTGDGPITCYRASLPWESAHSLLLSAMKLDALGTQIRQVHPIDDPGIETMTLSPHQQIEGRIRLDPRFPALRDVLRTHDVMVFWAYQLEPVDESGLGWTSGSVILCDSSSRPR